MTRWEYARLESSDAGINVRFTHRQAWTGLAPEAFFETLRKLGDEGWELVAALPLAASANHAAPGEPTREPSRDSRSERDPRPVASAAGGPTSGPASAQPQTTTFHVTTDRWLVFKRPQPDAPPAERDQGADMIKGLVGRQLLKGRLPLP